MFKLSTTDHLPSKRCGKENESSNLLRRNFPRVRIFISFYAEMSIIKYPTFWRFRYPQLNTLLLQGKSPSKYARKGELDPTLYEHMFAMQTMLNPKDKDHAITNPMPSSFTKCGHNKILGRLCRSNSQNRPRLSNKGILKVSIISFGAALLLLYLLPGTLARYETSSFFPRLQYHKVICSYTIYVSQIF